jgi:2-amino-4-hydroxy-6-hydroxymethyldihydropteridine diphosphokinase
MGRYVIGLGSNLGDRLQHLCRGALGLAELGRVVGVSAVYESAAWGGPEQGPFLNAALSLEVELEPRGLLTELLAIERALGRERRERWGPRTLDLDLLWARDLTLLDTDLCIPHPRLTERTFALRPLLDAEPSALPPPGAEPYATILGRLSEPVLRRVAEPIDWAKGVEISAPDRHHALR